jgi:hypothetical protein
MRILRPTYGSVTATIALVAALGGTSYAAATITGKDIRNGSLTGADIKNASIKSRDIANGSLTGSDLRNGSLTSADVRDGSLMAADFKTGELRPGPPGPGGMSDARVRRVDVTVPASSREEATASCAAGEIAVGGGAGHSGAVGDSVAVLYSLPVDAGGSPVQIGDAATGWRAAVFNNLGGASRVLSVYALCTRP